MNGINLGRILLGFEVWLMAWDRGEEATLPVDAVKACFGPELEDAGDNVWLFDHSEIYAGKDSQTCLMIRKPTQRALESALKIMELGNVCLFWPGSCWLVLDPSVVEHFPPGIVEEFGFAVVKDMADIEKQLNEK